MDRLSKKRVLLVLLFVALLINSPLFINPAKFLERGNDLQEFFWPIITWAKSQILEHHTFPLWNNLFFSGTPLLPDPQSLLFYLPNTLFLLLPNSAAFLTSFLIHAVLAGLGFYFFARLGLGLSKYSSLFTAILYMASPKLAGYLEAGHFGLVASWAWLPFVLLASLKIAQMPTLRWAILLGASLAAVFFTHTITFLLVSLASMAVFLASTFSTAGRVRRAQLVTFSVGIAIMFGLTAVVLLPQLNWLPQTTRFLLLKNPDVYPYWASLSEFLKAVLIPWWGGKNNLWELDTEKWIALGILPTLLATIGFFGSNKKVKFFAAISAIFAAIVSSNNISPLYPFLLSWDWYLLMRVATRVWFIPVILTTIFAGLGIDLLLKARRGRGFILLLALGAIIELTTLSWLRLAKPVQDNPKLAPQGVYDFLKQDKEIFRVFCLDRCLSQKMVAAYNLQTVEGYGTLQQKNYYNQFIQLSQVFWDKYTLVLPPFEIYHFTNIQPYSPELADYNVKYVISLHKLEDQNFIYEASYGNYTIYRNTINKGRAYFIEGQGAPILEYSPNKIRVNTTSHETNELILAEVYNPGWKAYLNGQRLVPIQETTSSLRQVKIEKDTNFVEFVYEPEGYKLGQVITLATLFIVITVFIGCARKRVY